MHWLVVFCVPVRLRLQVSETELEPETQLHSAEPSPVSQRTQWRSQPGTPLQCVLASKVVDVFVMAMTVSGPGLSIELHVPPRVMLGKSSGFVYSALDTALGSHWSVERLAQLARPQS